MATWSTAETQPRQRARIRITPLEATSGIRPRILIRPPALFNRTASAALDDLIVQLERNPGRWRKRILRLRKMIWEYRAMGRAS
jgi:hypothetical protein